MNNIIINIKKIIIVIMNKEVEVKMYNKLKITKKMKLKIKMSNKLYQQKKLKVK